MYAIDCENGRLVGLSVRLFAIWGEKITRVCPVPVVALLSLYPEERLVSVALKQPCWSQLCRKCTHWKIGVRLGSQGMDGRRLSSQVDDVG